jgi:glycosyltransferase involved in cell wall biosynthesis
MDAFGTGVKQLIFKIHKLLLFKAFVKMSDLVMVTSRDYAQHAAIGPYLTRWPEKFVEVPNGVDVLHFQPARRDPGISQAYNILPSEKVVAFVGGLDKAHYFKGIEHLLASMASLRTAPYTWKVLIVGDGDLRSNYESLATQLNIAQRVIFTGYVPNDKLPAHYNLADVVVLPSVDQSEAFGMALAEGMACGKPGIASDLPGVRTVVEHQYTGLIVPPRDEKGLANTINHLLLHPELAAEYGRNGHRKAQRRYSWKQIGLQLNQLYQRLWVDV